MIEWSDLRYLLAVGRAGSTLAAAQVTGASQSTVARRIAALEAALDLKLFERLQYGSRLTDQGAALMRQAETVEAAVQDLLDQAASARRSLAGTIRFTMAPESADETITRPITAFMAANPGVHIEVRSTERFLDIAAGEADVALRAGPRPDDPSLVVRKVGDILWAGYCSPSYVEKNGAPAGFDDLDGHQLIGAEGQLERAAPLQWLGERASRFAFRVSSVGDMVGFAKAGAGIGFAPLLQGEVAEGLVRCLPPLPVVTEVWLITRDDVRRTPHVRAFLDYLYANLSDTPQPLLLPAVGAAAQDG
jgi:DNA-binding transcriptional LysR family regulator